MSRSDSMIYVSFVPRPACTGLLPGKDRVGPGLISCGPQIRSRRNIESLAMKSPRPEFSCTTRNLTAFTTLHVLRNVVYGVGLILLQDTAMCVLQAHNNLYQTQVSLGSDLWVRFSLTQGKVKKKNQKKTNKC